MKLTKKTNKEQRSVFSKPYFPVHHSVPLNENLLFMTVRQRQPNACTDYFKNYSLKKTRILTKNLTFNNTENNISDHINNIFLLYLYWYVEMRCVA
jgi:hypothetical protein